MKTWVSVLGILAIVVLLIVVNSPKCVRGHYETRHIPLRMFTTVQHVGKTVIIIPHVTPAHDEQCWVCDEYEKQRN